MIETLESRPHVSECGVVFAERGRWYAGVDADTKVPVSAALAQRIQFALRLNTALGVVEGGQAPRATLTLLLRRFREYNCHRTVFHVLGYPVSPVDAAGWCQDLVRRHIESLPAQDSRWERCTQAGLENCLEAFSFPCVVHTVNRTAPGYILPEHSFVVLGRADDGSYLCVGKLGLDDSPIRIGRLADELVEERPGDHIECYVLPHNFAEIVDSDDEIRRAA